MADTRATNPNNVKVLTSMRPLWGASRRASPIMRETGMKTVLAAATAPSGPG
jgi:hypothetical protein